MKTCFLILLFLSFGLLQVNLSAGPKVASEYAETVEKLESLYEIEDKMNYETGSIQIAGVGTLNVPAGFRFLGAEQSAYVLKDVWENLQSKTDGMLFTKDASLLGDDGYSINLKFTPAGYVSDELAGDINFDDILVEMKSKNSRVNKLREEKGMFPVELTSWADDPFYDKAERRLHWSKKLKYDLGGDAVVGLNYAIRFLGRTGFLEMNFVGRMDQLDRIKKDVSLVLSSWKFNDGFRYEEFDPKSDKVAAMDVEGLMIGGSKTPKVQPEVPTTESTEASDSSSSSSWISKIWPFLLLALITFLGMFIVSSRRKK